MSRPYGDPPAHGQIVGGLSVTPDLAAAIGDYRDVLGLELVSIDTVDPTLAAAWDAPATAGARMAGSGACSSCCWLAANMPSAAIASTAASGVA